MALLHLPTNPISQRNIIVLEAVHKVCFVSLPTNKNHCGYRILNSMYYSKIKKSLKIVTQSSFSATSKHQRWKENPISPSTDSNVVSANKAITYCCKTGEVEHARHMFDKMPERTVVSWNSMITGYYKWDMFPEALDLISLMHRSYVKLNETTFSVSLSVCGRAQSFNDGKEIHGLVLKSGYERFKLVGSALLYVYANCYEIGEGRRVFDELHEENELLWSQLLVGYIQCQLYSEALSVFDRTPRRGVVEWTTLISGYAKSEDGCERALELFNMMTKSCEAIPNEFTLDSVVRACGRLGDLWKGRVVHGLLIKLGFEFECSITSALIYFYSSCKVMDDAKRVFNGIVNPCPNDWNELIEGLVKLDKINEAELIFNRMTAKNPISYNLMIKGYAKYGRVDDSKKLFLQMPVKILASLNSMISVYSRNGEIHKALELFEKAKEEGSPITWNSMISGYIQNDQHENALKLYLTMRRLSVSHSRSTFSVLFHACACLGSLQQGQLLHGHLAKTPFSCNVYVATALVDMYSKCGSIADAHVVFSCISSPNVAAWTALINGYAHHGLGSGALSFFNLMLKQGINPNAATFVAVLSACTRAGLVNQGMRFFHLMKEYYGITPTVEHFTCIVDLLGRSGLLQEAEELIEGMTIEADKILLITLLNASWFWMDIKVGERMAEKMFDLDPYPSSACVIMSNMYSRSGKWGKTVKMRGLLRELGGKKDPGCSWIDVNNIVHVFSVDDRNHPNRNMICASLESLTRNTHCDVDIEFSLHN